MVDDVEIILLNVIVDSDLNINRLIFFRDHQCKCSVSSVMGNNVSLSVSAETSASSDCPVQASECPSSVGADGLDPRNMMPPANQMPAIDQPFPLPTNRQKSSIPRYQFNAHNNLVACVSEHEDFKHIICHFIKVFGIEKNRFHGLAMHRNRTF